MNGTLNECCWRQSEGQIVQLGLSQKYTIWSQLGSTEGGPKLLDGRLP